MGKVLKYNVCVIKPDGYLHSDAFIELAELIGYSLQDLGHEASLGFNQIVPDAINVIIGCHLLDPALIPHIPKTSVILNTEQVDSGQPAWNPNIFQWASAFETWDYSHRNIQRLKQMGASNVKFLQLGYHEKLARIRKAEHQDIDVLFYGSMNERRLKVVEQLKRLGCNVRTEFGVYGQARDQLIARAKVVLNLHFYSSEIFEIVRVFYLMTNSKAVVAEVNQSTSIDPCYPGGIYPAAYEELADSCMRLVRDDRLRLELEQQALETIKRLPQRELIAALLREERRS